MKKDIYIIKNNINDKVYIGQTTDINRRFKYHCNINECNGEIGRAIQELGKEHFHYEILESNIENYDEREQYWIQYYNSLSPNGYNVLEGGANCFKGSGINCINSFLTEEQVISLTDDLKKTSLSFVELAKKYEFKKNTSIYDFNIGKTYAREDIEYPIRKEKTYIGKLTDNDVDEIIYILKNSYRSYENIAKQFNVEYRAISRINRGILHKRDNEEYPIRIGKFGSKNLKFYYEQVTEIINLLQSTDKSLREIARIFNCEYRDILEIKNGTKLIYRRKELTYPLRSNN